MTDDTSANLRDSDRLTALRELALLDSPAELAFDRLTRLAANILHSPMALVSLVDEDRQFFKSSVGLPEPWASRRQTPLSHSFCQHVVASSQPLIISDAREHPLVCDNQAIPELGIAAYLGMPLTTSQGHSLGSFCVIDTIPRIWTESEVETLRDLAASVMTEIELRRDNAERQRAEEALDDSQRFLRSTLDALSAHIAILDASGTVIAVNAAWNAFAAANNLLGPTGGVGTNYLAVCEGATGDWSTDVPLAVRGIREVTSGERMEFYLEYPCHSPQEQRWFLMRVSRFAGHGPVRVVVAHENITERKRAEEAVQRSRDGLELRVRERTAELVQANRHLQDEIAERKRAEEMLLRQAAQLQEQAHVLDLAPVLVRDLENRIVLWNQGAVRMYGWSPEEALGRVSHELLQTQFPRPLKEIQDELMARGQWEGEVTQTHRDGSRMVVSIHWALHRGEDGQPKAILSVNTNITEEKKLEAQSLRAQRMDSIGTLAGGIAHDLNNVLTPILMGAELLKMKLRDPAFISLLDTMHASALRGADMVRQILQFARGVEGKYDLLQLQHVLGDVESMLQHTLPKSVEIHTSVPKDLWLICGDATQLHQVVLNLGVNARDAMPQGGRLTLTAENLTLDEQYARMHLEARPGDYVRITVADTGTGISPEVREKIFDPFFTTKEQGKGTGLGLSTVLGIVKSHGGFANVSSEVGQGSQFSVYLPAAEIGKVGPRERAPKVLPAGNGELILVVDDEAGVREITRATLEAHGYRVLIAGDGAEAVALFAQRRGEVRAVLTDMMMPVMDGPTSIRALQRLDPQVRVIAVTGLTERGKSVEIAKADVKAFLAKPFTAEALLMTLREVVAAEPSPRL